MTVWDCFTFFNELDVLEIRLRTLEEVVDQFVLCEATRTYAGDPKPLYYAANAERFAPWADRIRHVIYDAPGGDGGPLPGVDFAAAPNARWQRENAQRDGLRNGFDGMRNGDVVHLSDADEIPDPAMVRAAGQGLPTSAVYRPELWMHVGALNWRWPAPLRVISRFVRGDTMLARGPEDVRQDTGTYFGAGHGWHLSYLGGVDAIRHKLAQAAHRELGRPPFNDPDHIAACLRTGADLFDRPDRQCFWVGLDALPPPVQADPDRWRHLMAEAPA